MIDCCGAGKLTGRRNKLLIKPVGLIVAIILLLPLLTPFSQHLHKEHVGTEISQNYIGKLYIANLLSGDKLQKRTIAGSNHNLVWLQKSYSPSRDTLLFTPKRDNQPTCGISFRGLHSSPKEVYWTPKSDLQEIGF